MLRPWRLAALGRSAGAALGKRAAASGTGGGWSWGQLYASIATATGWRFDEIDRLSLDDVAELLLYWAEHPPVHVTAHALLVGLGGGAPSKSSGRAAARPASDAQAQDMSAGEFSQLIGVFGQPRPFEMPCRMLPAAPQDT